MKRTHNSAISYSSHSLATLKKKRQPPLGKELHFAPDMIDLNIWLHIFSCVYPRLALLQLRGVCKIWNKAIDILLFYRKDWISFCSDTANMFPDNAFFFDSFFLEVTPVLLEHPSCREQTQISHVTVKHIYKDVSDQLSRLKIHFPRLKHLRLHGPDDCYVGLTGNLSMLSHAGLKTIELNELRVSMSFFCGFRGQLKLSFVNLRLDELSGGKIYCNLIQLTECNLVAGLCKQKPYTREEFPCLDLLTLYEVSGDLFAQGLLAIPSKLWIHGTTHSCLSTKNPFIFASHYELLATDHVIASVIPKTTHSVVRRIDYRPMNAPYETVVDNQNQDIRRSVHPAKQENQGIALDFLANQCTIEARTSDWNCELLQVIINGRDTGMKLTNIKIIALASGISVNQVHLISSSSDLKQVEYEDGQCRSMCVYPGQPGLVGEARVSVDQNKRLVRLNAWNFMQKQRMFRVRQIIYREQEFIEGTPGFFTDSAPPYVCYTL